MTKTVAIPAHVVMSKIYQIRGHKVTLDRDLADLYGVKPIPAERTSEKKSKSLSRKLHVPT